jgi:hypothetical protein
MPASVLRSATLSIANISSIDQRRHSERTGVGRGKVGQFFGFSMLQNTRFLSCFY